MLDVERLHKEWRENTCLRRFEPGLSFTDEGLVLGNGIALARRRPASGRRDLALDGAEERVLALLSIAYQRIVSRDVLDNIRRASDAWRDGEITIALIHLARTGLPPLSCDAGYRLFAADKLLAAGVAAETLLKACDIDAAELRKAGYNPDEPRLPAGNPGGGEWTISGLASWCNLPGQQMANGKIFDPHAMAAAMRAVPLGTKVVVQSAEHPSRTIAVVVTDRGPYVPGRVIDLTPAAFAALFGGLQTGLGRVNVKVP